MAHATPRFDEVKPAVFVTDRHHYRPVLSAIAPVSRGPRAFRPNDAASGGRTVWLARAR